MWLGSEYSHHLYTHLTWGWSMEEEGRGVGLGSEYGHHLYTHTYIHTYIHAYIHGHPNDTISKTSPYG